MRTIISCRSCGSNHLEEILDLGFQYLSDFREDDSKPSSFPLVAVLCMDCMLVQLRDTAPSGEMYHENYGFKSGVSNSIKEDLEDVVANGLEYNDSPLNWLDIASNDGTLLSFVPKNTYRVGVDPIGFLCEEAKPHANEIINDFFTADLLPESDFDVITSISCFYDMDDPNKFVSDVAQVLTDDGIWIIQQNYLLTTMQLDAVDNFCHEHIEYYTLMSLEPLLKRHGLKVISVSTSMVNGGSIRTIVTKADSGWDADDSVEQQRLYELRNGLDKLASYQRFARDVNNNLVKLKELIDGINKVGGSVAILAASTRGSTIWQAAGIDGESVDYAVERNPAKVGRYFSAIGVPIISEDEAHLRKPDYMVIGPWFFADEIIEREMPYLQAGGTLIKPLPELEVISA